jgi:hypothetical protein
LLGRHVHDGTGATRDRRERLAREAYARAKKPLFTNPLYLALALNYRLRPVTRSRPPPPSLDGGCLYYAWSGDAQDVGLHVYQCLAGAILAEEGRHSSDTEQTLLAAELALPEHLAKGFTLAHARETQTHVPRWWVDARMMGFRVFACRAAGWQKKK